MCGSRFPGSARERLKQLFSGTKIEECQGRRINFALVKLNNFNAFSSFVLVLRLLCGLYSGGSWTIARFRLRVTKGRLVNLFLYPSSPAKGTFNSDRYSHLVSWQYCFASPIWLFYRLSQVLF